MKTVESMSMEELESEIARLKSPAVLLKFGPLPEPGDWNFRECPKCGNKKADIWVDTKGGKIKEHHRCKLCGMHEISW